MLIIILNANKYIIKILRFKIIYIIEKYKNDMTKLVRNRFLIIIINEILNRYFWNDIFCWLHDKKYNIIFMFQ